MRTLALSVAVALLVGTAAVAGAQPVSAVKLQLKEKNGKQKLLFLSKDKTLVAPAVGGPNDPRDVGAELTLCASNGNSASFAFVAGNWSANAAGTLYKYKVKGKPAGPKVAQLKSGKTLKVVGGAVGLSVNGTLGAVGVRMTMGSLVQCTRFMSAKKDVTGQYDARNAAAPADCSSVTLGCSSAMGAFVH
ncbi:MAG: hypothetical protein KIT14_08140 [bacterium]|nr:hypothetical protein [bacterium]